MGLTDGLFEMVFSGRTPNIDDLISIYKKESLTLEDCETLMDNDNGDLYIPSDSNIKTLPDNLVIRGSLLAQFAKLKSLPNGLVVGDGLNIHGTKIATIPDDICVNGCVCILNTPIDHIPDGMNVINGDLLISHTKITTLPDGLVVNGDLLMNETAIEVLPNGLVVKGDFDASESSLKFIPTDAIFGGSVDLSNTNVDTLPSNLTHINGSLYLALTSISLLPTNLYVGGHLDIYGTRITTLPKGLCVRNSVNADKTYITHISDNTIVGSNVYTSSIPSFGKNVMICGRLRIYPPSSGVHSVCRISDKYYGCHPFITEPNQCISDMYIREDTIIGDGVWYGMYYESDTTKKHIDVDLPLGDYVEGKYIRADGIVTPIKSVRQVAGYTVYKGIFKGYNLITDGEYYAHCNKIKDGIKDIEYKRRKDRVNQEYKALTLDSVVDRDYAIIMYRAITGACARGTQMFVESLGDSVKDEYTIAEIIELTDGRYGSRKFKAFFNKED
jgi:hypothetical protein